MIKEILKYWKWLIALAVAVFLIQVFLAVYSFNKGMEEGAKINTTRTK
jgi:DNA-binding transcriptional regulator of glucitol operon